MEGHPSWMPGLAKLLVVLLLTTVRLLSVNCLDGSIQTRFCSAQTTLYRTFE
jgi:hypothetical protein